jgi:pimeloyl-ACP methyl ester carboxylesterase
VIAYDLRGHGLSDKPPGAHTLNKHTADLLGLMDALGAESADLAGQSLGGLIALHTAASRPDRVRRVAVMNCAATFPADMRERFFELASDASFNGMEYAAAVMTELSFSPAYAKANPGLLDATRQGIQRGDTANFIAAARLVSKVDISENLPGVQAPTLVFAADADAMIPPAAAEALCDGLPQATLAPLKNCGHAAPLEQPAAIVAGLASFLE